MSRKSKIEERANERITQLKKELSEITLLTKDYENKIDHLHSNIILLQELLTAPDDKELI